MGWWLDLYRAAAILLVQSLSSQFLHRIVLFLLFARVHINWKQTNHHIGTTTLLIISHLLFGITRTTSDETSDIASTGERPTQEGIRKAIKIKRIKLG